MAQWLKQSTAATVKMGPFLDDTDGKTAETALTISQADIRLSKNGGDYAQTNNAAGATHDEAGEYDVPLDTTDTNTLGRLRVRVSESGALPVWQDFMVVPANVYDSLIAGSDKVQVDVAEWLGTAAATPTVAGVPEVDVTHWLGTAAATPTVAGVPEVDLTHIAGVAASTSTAQLGVNVVNFGGSVGTFASGIPAVNSTQISGSAAAADNAEIVFDTDFATNYSTSADKWQVTTVTFASAASTAINDIGNAIIVDSGTVGATGNTTTTVDLDTVHLNLSPVEHLIFIEDGLGTFYTRWVTAFDSGTNIATFTPALPVTPTAGFMWRVLSARRDTRPTDVVGNVGGTINGFTTAAKAEIQTEAEDALTARGITSTLFSGITSLAQWLGLMAGKQTGNATARTEVRATGAGSGTYDETTDSQEALADNAAPSAAAIADAVLDELVTGHPTLNSVGWYLDQIKDQTDLITTGAITVIGALSGSSLTLKRGDTYGVNAGQTLVIDKPSGASWPSDLTSGWTLTFRAWVISSYTADVASGDVSTLTKTCVVVDADSFRIDLTASDTGTLHVGPEWEWKVEAVHATSGTNSLISGTLTVVTDNL